VAVGTLIAQSPDVPDWQTTAGGKMAFEVASVKPTKEGTFVQPSFWLNDGDAKPPGGRFRGSFTVALYINFAYKLDGFQFKEMSKHLRHSGFIRLRQFAWDRID
jgi:hypothetical protein